MNIFNTENTKEIQRECIKDFMENTLFNKFILYIIYCHRNNIFTIIDPEREGKVKFFSI